MDYGAEQYKDVNIPTNDGITLAGWYVPPRKTPGAVGLLGGAHIALNAAYLDPDRMAALWLDGIQIQRIDDFPGAENVGERFAMLINA